jgi:serine/threonine protein kinase
MEGKLEVNPRWVAPEILEGLPYSTYSDVYAFGLILWELRYRKLAYDEEVTESALFFSILFHFNSNNFNIIFPKSDTRETFCS